MSKVFVAFVISAITTLGFGMMYNTTIKTLLPASLAGGLSWIVYEALQEAQSGFILSGFIAAFLVGTLGEFLARKYRSPATLFILPGLIPLVPGAGMYYTMRFLVEKNYALFLSTGVETFFTAASLALGVVASSVFSKSLRGFKRGKHKISIDHRLLHGDMVQSSIPDEWRSK